MTQDLPYEEPEPPVDPEFRTAKAVLFLLVFVPLVLLVAVLLLFFQPDHQVFVQRHVNGYPKTRTEYVVGPAETRVKEGRHQAWYLTGLLAEEGHYLQDQRQGEWRFWSEGGELDGARSGIYEADERVGPLPE